MDYTNKSSTIMYTVIDGYSDLLSEDKQKAHSLLERARKIIKPLVDHHNGEWHKDTLSSFPNPADAVNCAVQIQRKLKHEPDINLRIGIHIGDTLFGTADGVKVSSGIVELAEPECVYISEQVYYAVRNKLDIEVELLGEKTLENVIRPIKVYCLKNGEVSETTTESPKEKTKPSIAVLPFVNMSADSDQEWFCDGIAETIIDSLSHVEELRVVARTSSFYFKGKDVEIAEIGKKLNVDNIMEGSIQKAGNRLRITVQLIKIDDLSHLWSEKFDRELEDIFAIQDEISLAIVEALRVKLLKKEKEAVVKRHTDDHEAYSLYLLGRHYWNIRTEKEVLKGLEYFRRAIDKDYDYALAYTGIADSYNILAHHGFLNPNETYPKARDAAKKALAIDDKLSEAHAALGYMRLYYDWDWVETELECRKAIKLNPNNAMAHHYLALYLSVMGRLDEALAESKQAQELDPLAQIITSILGMNYCYIHRYDKAMEQFQKVIELMPNFMAAHYNIGFLNLYKGNYKEAIEAFQKDDLTTWSKGGLGFAYGMCGERDKALQLIDELIERKNEMYFPSYFIAGIYSGLGENDKTFEWLDKAYNEHDSQMIYLKLPWPWYEPIRYDPRFKTLLRKMGLSED